MANSFCGTAEYFAPEMLIGNGHNYIIDWWSRGILIYEMIVGIPPFFHKNNEAFLNQKYRDDMKRRMCKDNKITLIEVPNTIDISNIENYLITKLKIEGKL